MLMLGSMVVYGSKATMVVDPGWLPEEIDELRDLANNTPARRATHVLLTHGDVDHVVGWNEFGETTLVAHPLAKERDPEQKRQLVREIDERHGINRPGDYRYPPAEVFTSPDRLDLGGLTALFFSAPGHTNDSMFTVLPERKLLIAGDYMIDMEGPYILNSVDDFRNTLLLARKLCDEYGIETMAPGHGHVATSRREIDARLDTDLDYVDRLRDAVSAAVQSGKGEQETVDYLRAFLYRGHPVEEDWMDAHEGNIHLLYAGAMGK
jgi:glyoxylase-like metal-dependent hydrolase (beta-lactamase superfamily II)